MASRALAIRNRALCIRNRALCIGCAGGGIAVAVCGTFNDVFGGVASQGVATADDFGPTARWRSHPGLVGARNDIILTSDNRMIVVGNFTVNGSTQTYMAAQKVGGGPWEPLGDPVPSGQFAQVVKEFRTGLGGSIILIGGRFTIGGVPSLAYVWGATIRPIPFTTMHPWYASLGTPEFYNGFAGAPEITDISANEIEPIVVPGQAHGPIVVCGTMRLSSPGTSAKPGGTFSLEVPRSPPPLSAGPPAWLDNPTWIVDSRVDPPTIGSIQTITTPATNQNNVTTEVDRVISGSQSSEALMLSHHPRRRVYSLRTGRIIQWLGINSWPLSGTIGTRYLPPAGLLGHRHVPSTPTYNTQVEPGAFRNIHASLVGGSQWYATEGSTIYMAFGGPTGMRRPVGGIDPGYGQWEIYRQISGSPDFIVPIGGTFANATSGPIRDLDAADGRLFIACRRLVFVRDNALGTYQHVGGHFFPDNSISAIAAPKPLVTALASGGCGCNDCQDCD